MSSDILAGAHALIGGHYSVASGMVDVFKIPSEFAELFNSAYMQIIEKQQELLKT